MNSEEKKQSLKLAEHYFRDHQHEYAKYLLEKIIQIDHDNSKANELFAYIYENAGQFDLSFKLLNVACNQSDCSPEALYYLGSMQLKRGLFDQAIETLKKSILKAGEFFEALHDLATAQASIGDTTSAIINYQKCLYFGNPSHELFYNIAGIFDDLRRFDEAITYYDKALSLSQYIDWVPGYIVFIKMKMCSWSTLAESLVDISKKVMANEKVMPPFPLLALSDDALIHKKSSEIFTQSKYPFNSFLGAIPKHSENQKIRIGYFSADFRNHPVSSLVIELFELHDKSKFEITAFSFGVDDKSPMRLRLSEAFNQFIDVSTMSDMEIAKLARDLQIDIAVDLGGHTAHSRTGIFSYRAAPIQTSYIGYLGTMGAHYYDYLLADKILIPGELKQFYTEKIAYLDSYQANDRKRVVSKKHFSRLELGLPEKGFVFCCFNNNYKILPPTFDGWMRVLKAVEGSVLFLYAENQWAEANLKEEAKIRGVDSSRLVFGRHMPNDEYLARYQSCDLFLDTFPYSAGTTASDALWAGLPVLTLMGRSFASRMAASLLKAIGLPELITTTQEEYEASAIELANNLQKLLAIKKKLANNRLSTPLFDTPLFTRNIENAYIKMHERCLGGLKPDHIFI